MSDMLELAKRIAERAGKNAKVAPELLYAPILWELQDDARSSADSAVEGKRDAIVQLIHKHIGVRQRVNVDLTGVEDAADAILRNLNVPQTAPKLEALESCKGEQLKFEEWAAAEKYDMHEHPLHYLFMDDKTNAARQGWKAALRYAATVIAGAQCQAVSAK
jgi:hypothetical protein